MRLNLLASQRLQDFRLAYAHEIQAQLLAFRQLGVVFHWQRQHERLRQPQQHESGIQQH